MSTDERKTWTSWMTWGRVFFKVNYSFNFPWLKFIRCTRANTCWQLLLPVLSEPVCAVLWRVSLRSVNPVNYTTHSKLLYFSSKEVKEAW